MQEIVEEQEVPEARGDRAIELKSLVPCQGYGPSVPTRRFLGEETRLLGC